MANAMGAVRIGMMRCRRSIWSRKSSMILLLMGLYAFSAAQPIADFARSLGMCAPPYAPPFMISDQICQLFLTMVALALFADAPYKDDLYPYLLARSGRAAMVLGNVLGILFTSLCYVTFLFLAMSLPFLPQLCFSPTWGKVWSTLAAYGMSSDFESLFSVSDAIRSQFSPLQAMALSYGLEVSLVLFLGIAVYLGNQFHEGRPVGLWFAGFFIMLDVTIYNIFPDTANRFSPLGLARLSSYTKGFYMPMNRSPAYGFLFLLSGTLMMAFAIWGSERLRKNSIA